MKLQFLFRNETKGALRYQEVDENGRPLVKDTEGATVNTLYLRKSAMGGRKPKAIAMQLVLGDDDAD